ncbi:MAG: Succinyl-CoA:(R)-benzylsuccinate CoA-transferase subunit BbsE [Chlorobi bacterium OLB4]|jgi:Predicted acyl-CoA transferases/carnitine dehydratase|nr:MAG: Succinyl-CoA:(R)-benzylsuccinate CoA-transferase subunit BbsE [Chlorobi bacterium OLB4]MBW7855614.1 CoA transferase [Ignavibacteria bacterium]OQY79096.1 MAG: hypothetical protein B6D43_00420 [Ignavibacteriales bacterium UTCHB1]
MLGRKTILSLEQALALPYATQRFVQLGWRVIRIEIPGNENDNAGDPNRYIGAETGYHDLHSYYIAPNIGKEAITINLKSTEGKILLQRLIRGLKVDVFMCNTLPVRYNQLGIDFETLSKVNPSLIWCGISAFGKDEPDKPGYDPALQALCGFTYLTGEPDRNPVPCGVPVIDLKAGDEAFIQVILAMLELEHRDNEFKNGKEINISMVQCAASWLITALPQLNFVSDESELFQRSGNEHRSFIPCNIYPTKDGFVYLAIGNDSQWARFASYPGFESFSTDKRKTNAGRMEEKNLIYSEIGNLTQGYLTNEFIEICNALGLSASPVNSIKDVAEINHIRKNFIKTILPDSKPVSLFPPSHNTDFLVNENFNLKLSPRLGEHNFNILQEIGLNSDEIEQLKANRVI